MNTKIANGGKQKPNTQACMSVSCKLLARRKNELAKVHTSLLHHVFLANIANSIQTERTIVFDEFKFKPTHRYARRVCNRLKQIFRPVDIDVI